MLQYLVILLDAATTSYCHYEAAGRTAAPIAAETLEAAIRFAMRENLNVQFVYPAHELPTYVDELVETVDHTKIKPARASRTDDADVIVVNGWAEWEACSLRTSVPYVLRTDKQDLFGHANEVTNRLKELTRLNLVLTDVETFTDADFRHYADALDTLADEIVNLCAAGRMPQVNVLTDRLFLDKMNNCGAGLTQLTLAPDGKFYLCPAFYGSADSSDGMADKKNWQANSFDAGRLATGPQVKNAQLYRLDHAPLCRRCDAWQCRRCVWLNLRTTFEVNTPSHEQCVVAHTEREASRRLLEKLHQAGISLPGTKEIKKITYSDPFDIREKW